MNAPSTDHYDLIAIGSGPAGRHAAVEAARLGARVALVERRGMLGGVARDRGTLPFGTLRAAVIDAMAVARIGYSRSTGDGGRTPALADLLWRVDRVVGAERDAIIDELRRARIDVLSGSAAFAGPRSLTIRSGGETREVTADRFVLAVGTAAARPAHIDFDDISVLDPDGILSLPSLPDALTVVGAGVIGLECASVAAALGVRVTLLERRDRLPDALDDEIAQAMLYHLRGIGVAVRLETEVAAVTRRAGAAIAHLAEGSSIEADALIYAAGRVGRTASLDLRAAGLRAAADGLLTVDGELRTAQPHIFAAGEVTGSRGTSAAAEQGRRAARAALGKPTRSARIPVSHSLSTIPEIAWVGATGRELADGGVHHVRGTARYRDLRRGEMSGDPAGLLTLLVDVPTHRVLGVHLLGTSAAEMVHIGQTVMAAGLPPDYLLDAVVDVPTYAEIYTLAARDALERLREAAPQEVSALLGGDPAP